MGRQAGRRVSVRGPLAATAPRTRGAMVAPGGQMMANTWRGFPWQNLLYGRLRGRPRWIPANGYGLYDGNVWEWTCEYFTTSSAARATHAIVPAQPRVDSPGLAGSPASVSRKVIKGGSHLCALQLLPALLTHGPGDRRQCHLPPRLRCISRQFSSTHRGRDSGRRGQGGWWPSATDASLGAPLGRRAQQTPCWVEPTLSLSAGSWSARQARASLL